MFVSPRDTGHLRGPWWRFYKTTEGNSLAFIGGNTLRTNEEGALIAIRQATRLRVQSCSSANTSVGRRPSFCRVSVSRLRRFAAALLFWFSWYSIRRALVVQWGRSTLVCLTTVWTTGRHPWMLDNGTTAAAVAAASTRSGGLSSCRLWLGSNVLFKNCVTTLGMWGRCC